MRLTGAALVSLVLATPLEAQAPYLVSDVNQTPYSSSAQRDPEDLEATPSALYFVGFDVSNGHEIHRLSGSGQLTMTIDLDPGPGSANTVPQRLAAAGDILYFEFDDGIYRTDGTAAGTTLLRQFGPDFVELQQLTGVGSGVFFVELTNLGKTLWWSDGTPAGTIPLSTDDPESLTRAGGRLFFAAEDASGRELWTSDGTVAGTVRVKDICPGACPGLYPMPSLVDAGGTLYFIASDGVNGRELWKSNGTGAGTVMVANVLPDSQGFDVTAFGSLVLMASDRELWRSDGTPGGTFLLRSGVWPREIHDAGGLAFFDGDEDATGRELWKTDGTPGGTALVVDACPGTCSFFVGDPAMGSVPGVLLVTNFDGTLWRSDGTAAGTFLVRSYDTTPPSFTRFAGLAYFAANDGESGRELWRSDGTVAGTQMVHDAVDSSSFPIALSPAGDRFFASAYRTGQGRELWSTAGTPASSTFVELEPGTEDNDFSTSHALGDRIVTGTFALSGRRLWISDGSPAGTSVVASGFSSSYMGSARGLVFFNGAYPPGNAEPWRTDGTPAGTFNLQEIGPALPGSHPDRFVAFRDRAWFRAFVLGGYEVWRSDGTTAGTSLAISFPCLPVIGVADTLYLQCSDPATGFELWASDGTASGTRLVKDIVPGPQSAFVGETVEMGGILYFPLDDGVSGWELWRSDGTEAGTYRVRDIAPGPSDSLPMDLATLGGTLYFAAETAAAGYELWRSDGTEAGTVMVRDLNPGPGQGVFELEAAGGRLLLSAYTGARGIEPWISDGSDAGTLPLPEIAPGPSSSWPISLRAVAGRVHFTANDGITGLEPWAVTMPAGAVSVADVLVQEGDTGTRDVAFEVRLESASPSVVQVGYTTVAGTAQAGADFEPRSGVVTFPPGATTATVDVPVLGDLADEPDETFRLDLSPVANAVVADPVGLAVILDDDGPVASITGVSVAEGDAGSTPATFTVTLATSDGGATPNAKTVGFATAPGTATSGLDYIDTAGTLTFPAGTANGGSMTIPVTILGDVVDEPDETFRVALSQTSDLAVPPSPATGVILDDDGVDAEPAVELTHGSVLRATLAPPAGRTSDRDWYVVAQQPRASYEVVVDETSGDAIPLQVDRMGADGSTVLQSATAEGTGGSVSLRWANDGSVTIVNEHVRVGSAACGTSCGADDGYRARLYETTLSAPRINNSGTQVTVAIVQNTTDRTIAGRLHFWSAFGALGNYASFQLPPRQVLVFNTTTYFFGGAGSLTVTHDGPYGSLVGKAVALEPATGFSFDTPMTYRPR